MPYRVPTEDDETTPTVWLYWEESEGGEGAWYWTLRPQGPATSPYDIASGKIPHSAAMGSREVETWALARWPDATLTIDG